MKRRDFLMGCGAGAATVAMSRWNVMASPFLQPRAFVPSNEKHTFVLLFLRGGCDGLNLFSPYTDQYFNDARAKGLKVSEDRGLRIDDEKHKTGFQFHPKAKEMFELYESGDMAIIHAGGLIHGTRSHFDAMDLIEHGVGEKSSIRNGWMARYLEAIQANGKLPGISMNGTLADAFQGNSKAISLSDLRRYDLIEGLQNHEMVKKLYANDSLLGSASGQTLSTIQFLQSKLTPAMKCDLERGSNGYPTEWFAEELSQSLQQVAQLIKMNAGARMINVDYGGWDTHERQQFVFPNLVEGLSKSLFAFYNDMKVSGENVTVLVMSEFGRRLRSNRSGGTDHGHGNVMFALGPKVKGGKLYGTWPGLHPDQLDKGVDLAITTDYRNVLSNILQNAGGMPNAASIFPGFKDYSDIGFI